MSYSEVKPYFRARIRTVDSELTEWSDGFNFENIPSTNLDGAYHIEWGPFANVKQNQDCLDTSGTATIRIFSKGFRDPQSGIDSAISKGESIIKECLKASNRALQPGIKNVKLLNFAVDPLAASNDNSIRTTISFDLTLVINI